MTVDHVNVCSHRPCVLLTICGVQHLEQAGAELARTADKKEALRPLGMALGLCQKTEVRKHGDFE